MDTLFVVIDIGCIECGEESSVIGVFTDESVANKAVEDHQNRQQKDWHGQHSFLVQPVELNKEYPVTYAR